MATAHPSGGFSPSGRNPVFRPRPPSACHATQANQARNAASATLAATVPAVCPAMADATPCTPRATSLAPLAHPCREARFTTAVTDRHPANTGAVLATTTAANTPRCPAAAPARPDPPGGAPAWPGRSAVHHHIARGRSATTFTIAAAVISPVTASGPTPILAVRPSRRTSDPTTAAAPASPRPTRASLCPPPTMCTTTTGFRTRATAANASLPGRSRPQANTANPAAAATAPADSALNAVAVAPGDPRKMPATAQLSRVKTGPYTERVPAHAGEMTGVNGSPGNALGGVMYGFEPCTASIRPYAA